jgi:hypothetical protein
VTFRLAVAVACAYAEDDMRSTAAAVERPTFTSVLRIDVAPFEIPSASAEVGNVLLSWGLREDSIRQ